IAKFVLIRIMVFARALLEVFLDTDVASNLRATEEVVVRLANDVERLVERIPLEEVLGGVLQVETEALHADDLAVDDDVLRCLQKIEILLATSRDDDAVEDIRMSARAEVNAFIGIVGHRSSVDPVVI